MISTVEKYWPDYLFIFRDTSLPQYSYDINSAEESLRKRSSLKSSLNCTYKVPLFQ